MKKFFPLLVLFLFSAAPAFCGQLSDVTLDDGSVIRAEVVALQNGKYTLNSPSLGTISLDASRVRSINMAGSVPQATGQPQATGPSPAFKEQVQDAQAQLLKDPEAMAMVGDLAADPAFKQLISDPEAMAALNAGDVEKLKNDPRFDALMQNPRMQAIAAKLMNKK